MFTYYDLDLIAEVSKRRYNEMVKQYSGEASLSLTKEVRPVRGKFKTGGSLAFFRLCFLPSLRF